MQQKKLELLAPAGDWERLEMALAYGADAVYLAGNTFGMRSFAGNFSPEELRRAANEYCEDALRRTEEAVAEAYDEIKKSRTRFRSAAAGAAPAPQSQAFDAEAEG